MGCGHSGGKDVTLMVPEAMDTKEVSNGGGKSPSTGSQKLTNLDVTKSSDQILNVLGKYRMSLRKEDIMGEGTSSICRKATNCETGATVAIKVYKAARHTSAKSEDIKMQKFKRQIAVLEDLQKPLEQYVDQTLWHEQLSNMKMSRLFMTLIDYSTDSRGHPGVDKDDGILYVITEIGQYSLKDYLVLRRDQARPLPERYVRSVTEAIILVMAGLHAKGYVHVDLKPENLMMFDGRLKLIDLDGCVKSGTSVSVQDSSISFSPCYCAPEWARFLIKDSHSRILVMPHLDVWSVGMTLCELVTLDAVFKPMFANFVRNAQTHREAGFLFMDWLSSLKSVCLPPSIAKFDTEFNDLLMSWLLVCDVGKRKSLAQCLSSPYLKAAREVASAGGGFEEKRKSLDSLVSAHPQDEHFAKAPKQAREKGADNSKVAFFKGVLFRLNKGGRPDRATDWTRTDMWIASNGSLCYFSYQESKRLVLLDCAQLSYAKIFKYEGGARPNAFEVRIKQEGDDDNHDSVYFACETPDDYEQWTTKLQNTINMDIIKTMQLGQKMAEDINEFKLTVKNRRMKVESDDEGGFGSIFKAKLWKVKADGDRRREEDWFLRDMWLSKNGSLVYWSKRDDRELVYYTQADIAKASLAKIANDDSCKPWSFQVRLPPWEGIEFAPGEFAAETEAMRETWINAIAEFSTVPPTQQKLLGQVF